MERGEKEKWKGERKMNSTEEGKGKWREREGWVEKRKRWGMFLGEEERNKSEEEEGCGQ